MSAQGVYKLRTTLHGHSTDVRAVAVTHIPEYGILTGSRDNTACLWTQDSVSLEYVAKFQTAAHGGFVSCVCYLPPDDVYPDGIFLTGCNDKLIRAFKYGTPQPIYQLHGHLDNVACLTTGKFGTVVSGSWDKTARIWVSQKCILVLEGHTASIWAVAVLPEVGQILTASADKTIKMWKAGNCERTFHGHDDCVRGLAVISSTEFLSCANDASIRHWLTSGECAHIYYSHTNYVYSLSLLPNGMDFVSAGEDRSLKVWKSGNCVQTIKIPAQSVWSVVVLPNGDVACGSSDGLARIFTTRPELFADDDQLRAFDEAVSSTALNASELGDLKLNELPGQDVLSVDGKSEGEIKVVKVDEKPIVFQWNSAEKMWLKIGDVVGANDASSGGKKTMHEGKEYDYVFSVDLEEGAPPIKLPFNITDDPWHAAQEFIHKHQLSQMFLDRIANFIITNTKGIQIGPQGGQDFYDPFTGANRYVPGSTMPSGLPHTGNGSVNGHDPFTGGSRYISADAANRNSNALQSDYFPQRVYLTFDQVNVAPLLEKLKEFNTKSGDGTHKVEEFEINEVIKLAEPTVTCPTLPLSVLDKLFRWPNDILYPVLDILRLAIRDEKVNQHFCGNQGQNIQFLGYLLELLRVDGLPANQLMVLRVLCNMMKQKPGLELAKAHCNEIMSKCGNLLPPATKQVQIALATLVLNYSVAIAVSSGDLRQQCVLVLSALDVHLVDSEARFRWLVALGTLIAGDKQMATVAVSLNLMDSVQAAKNMREPGKIAACANDLERVLIATYSD